MCASYSYDAGESKFTGKERDTETDNDDFGARYYNNRFGRWLSADWSSVPVPVPYANLTNPQTLNLYSMVADDPESFADLDGHTGEQNSSGSAPSAGCSAPGRSQDGSMAGTSGNCSPNPSNSSQGSQSPTQQQDHQQMVSTVYDDANTELVLNSTTRDVTHNQDGSMTITTTFTKVTFDSRADFAGQVTYSGGYTTVEKVEANGESDGTAEYGNPLHLEKMSAGQAEAAVGSSVFESAKAQATPSGAELFRRAGNEDMAKHPLAYAAKAAGVLTPLVGWIPEGVHAAIAVGDIIHSVKELIQGAGND